MQFKHIESAYQRISSLVHQTPVHRSQTLDEQLGAEVYFKCENFQKVGAFKFRGALNSLLQLSEAQKSNGVIAYSSGNHAQAIACAGKLLGIQTTIVMPDNAPTIKLMATKGYGATVVQFDPNQQTREDVAAEINANQKLTLIPPFNNERVIAGQGTAAFEFHQMCPDLEQILVPCGGGGLLSGIAIATRHMNPNCKIYGIEPKLADDATLSFKTGKLHSNPNPPTIADGTRTTSLGDITFPLIQNNVDDMITVSEEAIKEAVRFFFLRMKLVVEPSGALGLAALLSGELKVKGKTGIIVSGGNIDAKTMSEILQSQ